MPIASKAGLARLAQEQAALRRVATLVAGGTAPEEVYAAVLDEDPDHPLMVHYGEGLRQLGALLGDRGALDLVAGARTMPKS